VCSSINIYLSGGAKEIISHIAAPSKTLGMNSAAAGHAKTVYMKELFTAQSESAPRLYLHILNLGPDSFELNKQICRSFMRE
jgi:hypothetical protein